jgi:uncharacterized membrane protein
MSARALLIPALAFAGLLAACSPGAAPASSGAATGATAPAAVDPNARLDGDLTLFGKGTLWHAYVTGPDHAFTMTRPMFDDVQFAKTDVTVTGDSATLKAKDAKDDITVEIKRGSCEPGQNYPAVPFSVTITFATDQSKQAKTFQGCGGPGKLPIPGKLPSPS